MTSRPPIPEPIKREVRQKCGFGCVFCGLPIYEIDHVRPWAEVHEHKAANLVLLCPNHHAEFTTGRRSRHEIEAAMKTPHNLLAGSVGHVFRVSRPPVEVLLGTCTIRARTILRADDEPLISLENLTDDGTEVGLSTTIYDREGKCVLSLERNEWNAPVSTWDIATQGPRLTLRSAPHFVLLRIRVDPPSRIIFERGQMFFKGGFFDFSATELNYRGINRVQLPNCTLEGPTGIALSTDAAND